MITVMKALLLVTVSCTLLAQWPSYKTAGAPRLANGQIDMNAPAPKVADGHPDLSGIWDRGLPAPDPNRAAAPPSGPPPLLVSGAPTPPGPRPFYDLPSMLPGGLPMLPWAAELRKQRLAENSKDHPDAHCLPLHPVQLHAHPQPRKIVQTPSLATILYEANNGLRQIFLDGRTLPGPDVEPFWFGYSVGKWDGDALVVDSTGWKDIGWIDEEGTPITTTGKVNERFRRLNYGTLEIKITIDDPKTFTRPWSYTLNQKLLPDTELIEFICDENNRSVSHLVGK